MNTHRPLFVFILIVSICCFFFLFIQQSKPNVLGTTDVSTSPFIKDFYIPLGTGTNTLSDWVDVKGVAAYVDSRLYSKIKKITFEVGLGVPSENQTSYIRLDNAPDKHPVWYSEMTISGTGPDLLTSSPITLDTGNKLYQVQAKS